MRTRITHITMTPGVINEAHIPFISDAEIHIENQTILYAGKKDDAPNFQADYTIDGHGALAMPGLINLHTHTPMTLLRSVGSDLNLHDWLHNAIFPMERCLTDEAVRVGTDLGILEMLRYGTTSFCDMYMHMDAMAESVESSGMRALLGHGVVDFDESCADLDPGIAFAQKWHKTADDRIRVSIAPHSEGATTPAVIAKIKKAAHDMGLVIHVHVSETKADFDGSMERRALTPPAYLESMGILEEPVIAAHCVWFTDEDIDLFARRGVTIVHNPVSNLKLASGIAPIAKMLQKGCHVALGTDGVASNNNLNLWEEMKLMPLLQKGTLLDPLVITPAQVLASATSVGAKAMGYENLGLLKKGYLADLILVDMHKPNLTPCHDLENNLIYAAQGSDVILTMVNGKVLYDHGKYLTLNAETIMTKAQEVAQALAQKAQA